jgi:hypothetical protein
MGGESGDDKMHTQIFCTPVLSLQSRKPSLALLFSVNLYISHLGILRVWREGYEKVQHTDICSIFKRLC